MEVRLPLPKNMEMDDDNEISFEESFYNTDLLEKLPQTDISIPKLEEFTVTGNRLEFVPKEILSKLSDIEISELKTLEYYMMYTQSHMFSRYCYIPFDIKFIINSNVSKFPNELPITLYDIPDVIKTVDYFCNNHLQMIFGDNIPFLQKSLIFDRLMLSECVIRENLSSKQIYKKRISMNNLKRILIEILHNVRKNIIDAGEPVGTQSATSAGEPTTQLTLNTFHLAGLEENANVNVGMIRLLEIFRASKEAKNAFNTIALLKHDSREYADRIGKRFNLNILDDFVKRYEIVQDIDAFTKSSEVSDRKMIKHHFEYNTVDNKSAVSKLSIRLILDTNVIFDRRLDQSRIEIELINAFPFLYIISDGLSIMRLFIIENDFYSFMDSKSKKQKYRYDNLLNILKVKFIDDKLRKFTLAGYEGISGVDVSTQIHVRRNDNREIETYKKFILYTKGVNFLELLQLDFIDRYNTLTNDIWEAYKILGIEAAFDVMISELIKIYGTNDADISPYHIYNIICRLTMSGQIVGVEHSGMVINDIGILNTLAFERTTVSLIKSAEQGRLANINDPTAAIFVNDLIPVGTGMMDLYLKEES